MADTSEPRRNGGAHRGFGRRVARWNRAQRAERMRSLRGRAWRNANRRKPRAPKHAGSNGSPCRPAAEERERILLRRHEERERVGDTATLVELVEFHGLRGEEHRIRELVEAFMAEACADLEVRAWCYLLLGQSRERTREYEAALEWYREGVACEPIDPFTAYFLHNNLGYCLNVLYRPGEASWFCRTAIRIDPGRSNGFKNLGISLALRGDDAAALRAWMAATRVNPGDPRSLAHAERLLELRPDLLSERPELAAELAECRRSVNGARG